MRQDDPGKLLRLFRLANLLASRKHGFLLQEIIDITQVSKRTVYRDLEILEKCGFEIQKTSTGRWYIERGQDLSDRLTFSIDEAKLLRQTLAGLPKETAKLLRNKIEALSETGSTLNLAFQSKLSQIYSALQSAISGQKQVQLIDYQSFNSGTISNRTIEPFSFQTTNGLLNGYELSSKKVKQFKIDRIGSVKILDQIWQYEQEHQGITDDPFGGLLADQCIEVTASFDEVAATIWKEERGLFWHQRLQKTEDNRYILSEKFAHPFAIGRFVLGLWDHIIVLGNDPFKNYLNQIIHKTTSL
jgi:predicted DNA-binding transcriptional regulator YafY